MIRHTVCVPFLRTVCMMKYDEFSSKHIEQNMLFRNVPFHRVKTSQGHMAAWKGVCSLCAHSRTSSHFTSSIIDGLPWWGKAHCACLAGWVVGCVGCWHVAPVFSAALRCRWGPWWETGGQEPAVGEAVGTGAGQAAVRHPWWRFLVIDWTCLMHWDQLNGHRCADPTPQTLETDEGVYTEGWRWFWCHLCIDCRKAHSSLKETAQWNQVGITQKCAKFVQGVKGLSFF